MVDEDEIVDERKLLKDMTVEEVVKSSKEHLNNHEALHCNKCGELIVIKIREVSEVNYCVKADGTLGEELSHLVEMHQRLYTECGCRSSERDWKYDDGSGLYDRKGKRSDTKLGVYSSDETLSDLCFVKESVFF